MGSDPPDDPSEKLLEYLAYAIGLVIGIYLGFLFALIFIVIACIGPMLVDVYMKRKNVSDRLIKIIAWSNIIAWLLPPLGIFIGFSTIQFGKYIHTQKTKFTILGVLGIILALCNAGLGIFLRLNQ